jgi:thiamine biosynthesis protein ThiI
VQIYIRYDEVALKRGRRGFFEARLRENVSWLSGIPQARIRRIRGRLLMELLPDDDLEAVQAAIERTFGVWSYSLAHPTERTTEAFMARAVELAREARDQGHQTFKVELKRADKSFKVDRHQLMCDVGEAVIDAVGLDVDVHHPDVVITIEIRSEGTALHSSSKRGPGGVPSGTGGRALCLLSGGIDSPVAAWHMLKRGLLTDHVYFHAPPYTGDKVLDKTLTLARTLSRWTPAASRVFVPSVTPIQDAIQAAAPEELRIVLLRRSMYRLARSVAKVRGHKALVTGEALGQVASQTPENLLCVQHVVPDTLVLRPLIGLDKVEVVNLAERIDTYQTSILPHQDCCSLFAPKTPAVAATIAECVEAEAKLPQLPELEQAALDAMPIYRFENGSAPRLMEGEPLVRERDRWRAKTAGRQA